METSMLLVHKFFTSEFKITLQNVHFSYFTLCMRLRKMKAYTIQYTHKQRNTHKCKSFAIGNRGCVCDVHVYVHVYVYTQFIQREQIGSTTMPFRNSAFYILAEFSFHMIRSHFSSSNCTTGPVYTMYVRVCVRMCALCRMLETSCASHWLFAHLYINM